jgi:hypothetical protein
MFPLDGSFGIHVLAFGIGVYGIYSSFPMKMCVRTVLYAHFTVQVSFFILCLSFVLNLNHSWYHPKY